MQFLISIVRILFVHIVESSSAYLEKSGFAVLAHEKSDYHIRFRCFQ